MAYRLKAGESVNDSLIRIAREQLGKAMEAAYRDPDAARFHERRERTKYFRFQQRLLRPLWPAVVKQQASTASELGDLLGIARQRQLVGMGSRASFAGRAMTRELPAMFN